MLKELVSVAGSLDFILLDARAGFHDLGGLTIADISHAAVIFGINLGLLTEIAELLKFSIIL